MDDDSEPKTDKVRGTAFRFKPEVIEVLTSEDVMPQFNGGDADSLITETEDEELVTRLNSRVFELERKVDTLESELRMVRRKVRAMDVSRYGYDIITETVQRVLNDNSWNISRNQSRKSLSSDEDDEYLKRKQELKHRHKHTCTKRKVIPNPKSSTTPSRHNPPPPRQSDHEHDLRQKRKYKELLENDEDESDYIPPSARAERDEFSDEENYKSKTGKRQIKVEKVTVVTNTSKSKADVPRSGILKKEKEPSKRPLSERKVERVVDDSNYEDFKRTSTTGRKPKMIWVDFLTQRDDSGKIIASICKLCKQRVSARPYRMDQHLKACKKKQGHSSDKQEANEESDSASVDAGAELRT